MLLPTVYQHNLQAMLVPALSSSENLIAPYPAAHKLGEQPLCMEEYSKLGSKRSLPSLTGTQVYIGA